MPPAASLLSSISWLTASGMPGARLDWVYSAEFSLGTQGFSQRSWSLARGATVRYKGQTIINNYLNEKRKLLRVAPEKMYKMYEKEMNMDVGLGKASRKRKPWRAEKINTPGDTMRKAKK